MTFKVIMMGSEPYYMDVEDLNDLADLAGEYSMCDKFLVDFKEMTITIE